MIKKFVMTSILCLWVSIIGFIVMADNDHATHIDQYCVKTGMVISAKGSERPTYKCSKEWSRWEYFKKVISFK